MFTAVSFLVDIDNYFIVKRLINPASGKSMFFRSVVIIIIIHTGRKYTHMHKQDLNRCNNTWRAVKARGLPLSAVLRAVGSSGACSRPLFTLIRRWTGSSPATSPHSFLDFCWTRTRLAYWATAAPSSKNMLHVSRPLILQHYIKMKQPCLLEITFQIKSNWFATANMSFGERNAGRITFSFNIMRKRC